MANLTEKLSIAASAVIDALPDHINYSGPSADALRVQVEKLAHEVQQLIQALWGFSASNPD